MLKLNRTTLILLAAVLLLTGCLAGCRSKKAEVKPGERPTGEALAPGELKDAFETLTADYSGWDTLRVPFSARINGVGMTFSGNAYIERDRSIYISAKFLGMEVAVIAINTDSITVVDKYHRMYVSEPTGLLTALFPLTVGNLQDLLLGHCFIPGGDAAQGGRKMRKDMKLLASDGSWTASPDDLKGALAGLTCAFTVSNANELMSLEAEYANHRMIAYYGEPARAANAGSGVFASEVLVELPMQGKSYGGNIKWNFGKAIVAPSPKLRVPSDCRRITAAQLMRTIESL